MRLYLFVLITLFIGFTPLQAQEDLSISQIRWSPSENYISVLWTNPAVGGTDRIELYDAETLEQTQVLYDETASILSYAWSPDEMYIVTDNTVDLSSVYDTSNGEVLATYGTGIGGPQPSIINSRWNADGSLLANRYTFGSRFDIRDGITAELLPYGSDYTLYLEARDFGWHNETPGLIAITTFSDSIIILDMDTNTIVREFALEFPSYILGWHGNQIAIGRSIDDYLRNDISAFTYTYQIWNTDTGEKVTEQTIGDGFGSIESAEIHDNGRWLILSRPSHIIEIWELYDGDITQSQQFPTGTHQDISPQGDRLVSVTSEGELRIIEMPLSGERLPTPTPG